MPNFLTPIGLPPNHFWAPLETDRARLVVAENETLIRTAALEPTLDSLLADAFREKRVDARWMQESAGRLTDTVGKNIPTLVGTLSPEERNGLNHIVRTAPGLSLAPVIDYLAHISLFRAIQRAHSLPAVSRFEADNREGFVLLTLNGSLVSSPPLESGEPRRTLHYLRVRSHKGSMPSCETRSGILERAVMTGRGFRSTAFHTSTVTRILLLPSAWARKP